VVQKARIHFSKNQHQKQTNQTKNQLNKKIVSEKKQWFSLKKVTKRHLGNLRHFEIYFVTKTDGISGILWQQFALWR
jgi:hypothetical protein